MGSINIGRMGEIYREGNGGTRGVVTGLSSQSRREQSQESTLGLPLSDLSPHATQKDALSHFLSCCQPVFYIQTLGSHKVHPRNFSQSTVLRFICEAWVFFTPLRRLISGPHQLLHPAPGRGKAVPASVTLYQYSMQCFQTPQDSLWLLTRFPKGPRVTRN